MKKYIVKLNGKEYEVEIEEVTREENEKAAKAAPVSQAAAVSQAAPARPIAASSAGVSVKAPMPGAIAELKVKAGDTVREGQVLLVLEAMKMLNEIVAPRSGTISAVGVNKGDMVGSGDLLVTIG